MEQYALAAVKSPATPYAMGDNLQLDVTVLGLPERGEGLASSSAHLRFQNAKVPDLRVYNRFLSTQARIEGGSGLASADLRLDQGGNIGHGTVSVQGRGARMSMGGRHLQGDVAIDARLRQADLEQRRFVLDGSTLKLRNVGFRNADGRSRQGWWTEVELPSARIDLGHPSSVSGTVRARAANAGFLVDMFGGGRNLPAWTGRLVDSGAVQAHGRVQWKGDVLYRDVHHAGEVQWSKYNFEHADVDMLLELFNHYEAEARRTNAAGLCLPTYDYCLKCSHVFNILDARGAISVNERTSYIGRVRNLARLSAEGYSRQREEMGYPLTGKFNRS